MKDINILVFGDSIVYGAWDKEKSGWVNRLRQKLESKTNNYYNVYNLGIPGNTTSDLKERFEFEYKNRSIKDANNIIIFLIGINDTYIVNKKNNISLNEFKNNIIDLINKAKKHTENILFIGLSKVDESLVCPVSWDKNISYVNKEITKFDKELEIICKQNKVSYMNIYNLIDIKDLQDGLHPNDKGHQKIYNRFVAKLI